MPSNNDKDWEYSGDGGTWDSIKAGAWQGTKEFFRNPTKEIAQVHKDFTRADDLSSASTNSGGSSGSGNGDSSSKNNGAANWSKSKK